MKPKLLATSAALAFVLTSPGFAQTSPDQGMPGGTNRPQHREQDQGVKTGQNEKAAGSAQEESSAKASEGTSDKTGEQNHKGSKAVAQPEPNKARAHTDDRNDNRSTENKGDDRGASENRDDKRKQSTDRSRQGSGDQRAVDRDRGQDRERNTANQGDRKNGAQADRSKTDRTKSVSLDRNQQTRISASIRGAKVKPLTKVNFSIRVGTRVPASVHLHTLPADVVEIVPEYRGYNYFVVEDRIVIVEPGSHEIVRTIAYAGSSGRAERTQSRSSRLSDSDRKTIRTRTNTSQHHAVQRRYEVGERVPVEVDDYDLPDVVYTEVPTVRSYRYISRERGGVVLIDPYERRVIDVID